MAGRLGDILVRRGAITGDQLERALSTPGMLGDNLDELGYVTLPDIGSALTEQFEVCYVDLTHSSINKKKTEPCACPANLGGFKHQTSIL